MYYWTPSANIYLIYLKTLSLSTLEHENLWTRTITQLCARLLEWNMVPNHLLNVLSLRLCRINPVLCLLKDLAYLPHSLFSLITFISWSKTQRTLYRLVIQLKYIFELCFHKWLLSSIFSVSYLSVTVDFHAAYVIIFPELYMLFLIWKNHGSEFRDWLNSFKAIQCHRLGSVGPSTHRGIQGPVSQVDKELAGWQTDANTREC